MAELKEYYDLLFATNNMVEATLKTAEAIPHANGKESRRLLRVLFWNLQNNLALIDNLESDQNSDPDY